MAYTLNDKARSVTFKVATGQSESGKIIYTNRTVRHIAPEATIDDLAPVMNALGALQQHAVGAVSVADTGNIAEEIGG